MAIICNLEQLQTSIFDQDLNGGGTRIDGILDQFLQGVHRGHNNFPGCDLVDDVWVEGLCDLISMTLGSWVVPVAKGKSNFLTLILLGLDDPESSASSTERLVPRKSGESTSISSAMLFKTLWRARAL